MSDLLNSMVILDHNFNCRTILVSLTEGSWNIIIIIKDSNKIVLESRTWKFEKKKIPIRLSLDQGHGSLKISLCIHYIKVSWTLSLITKLAKCVKLDFQCLHSARHIRYPVNDWTAEGLNFQTCQLFTT